MKKLFLAFIAIVTLTVVSCNQETMVSDPANTVSPERIVVQPDGTIIVTAMLTDVVKGDTRTPAPDYGCRRVSANGVHYAVEYNNGYAIVTFAVNGRLYSFAQSTLEGQRLCTTDKPVFMQVQGGRYSVEDGVITLTFNSTHLDKSIARTPSPSSGCADTTQNGLDFTVEYFTEYALVRFTDSDCKSYTMTVSILEGHDLCRGGKNVFIKVK